MSHILLQCFGSAFLNKGSGKIRSGGLCQRSNDVLSEPVLVEDTSGNQAPSWRGYYAVRTTNQRRSAVAMSSRRWEVGLVSYVRECGGSAKRLSGVTSCRVTRSPRADLRKLAIDAKRHL